ncbi:MAG: hypothetical protein UU63_C0032G0008 [Candidatus Uhrbacteria bacterium GW2011_GWF2_41_430]|nr:MAG: hypothetical protein UU63_C0032G0008 [Candidatus Uhrbacteria bacterium GW2011_GWF2_41_430]
MTSYNITTQNQTFRHTMSRSGHCVSKNSNPAEQSAGLGVMPLGGIGIRERQRQLGLYLPPAKAMELWTRQNQPTGTPDTQHLRLSPYQTEGGRHTLVHISVQVRRKHPSANFMECEKYNPDNAIVHCPHKSHGNRY